MGDEHQFDGSDPMEDPPEKAASVPLVDRYRTCSSEELAAGFAALGGGERAIMAQRLAMLAVLDEREAWRDDGARDAAGWVAATDASRRSTGKAMAEVAKALTSLLAIATVVEAGGLSFDQLVPLCTLATPDTDESWAERASGLDAGQLAAEAAKVTRTEKEEIDRQLRARSCRAWNARGGGVRGSFYLPDTEAEVLLAGLDRLSVGYRPVPGEPWDPIHVRRADALTELAWLSIGQGAASGTAHIYVHAQAGVFGEDGDGWITLADGTSMARETLERLGCDATTQLLLHDETGAFVALGAAVHDVPRRVRRLLVKRDRCCRFPGCEATRGLHAHHIRFWSRQGKTEVPNLVLVCHRHHRLVHEGGWTLAGNPDNLTGLVFTRPDGRVVATEPAPCTQTVRDRLVPDPPPAPEAGDEPPVDDDDLDRCRRQRGATALAAIRARLRRDHLRDLANHAP